MAGENIEGSKERALEYIGLLVFWEAIDMVTDWILYADVVSIEPGLVYGPPDEELIQALLAFSIIGTLTFIAQVVLLFIEFCKPEMVNEEDSWTKFAYDSDLISLVTIILEDFPQAVITLTLVTCREEGISYVQIAKAILPIIEILARIICSFCNLCRKRDQSSRSCLKRFLGELKCVDILLWARVFGLGIVFMLNVAMLILTTTEKNVDVDGNSRSLIKGRSFKHIFDEEYNDERYLADVNIFLHHPDFDFENSSTMNLLSLLSIYDLENANVAEFRLLIDSQTKSKFVLEKSTCRDPFPKLSECFLKIENNDSVFPFSCEKFSTNFTTFALRFEYRERQIPHLLLGDINFKWKSDIFGNCSSYISNTTLSPSVHYYRSRPGVNTNKHLNFGQNFTRFFNTDDLIDVKVIWKTSFSSCQSKGRTSPNYDKKINLNCAS